jgi:hypothetical protein
MGLVVYHPTSVTSPDLPAVANEQSACWLTPSALNGRCIKNPGTRTRTRTRMHRLPNSAHHFRRRSVWAGLHAGFLSPMLRPNSDYLLSLCINSQSLTRNCLYGEVGGCESKVKVLTALVWGTGLCFRPMLIGSISPMENAGRCYLASLLSIERVWFYVRLVFLSWRVLVRTLPSYEQSKITLVVTKTRASEPC